MSKSSESRVTEDLGDEAYYEVLRTLFHGAPVVKHLPQRMVAMAPGRVTIEMPFDARLCHGGGAVHGGVLMGLLDNAAYFACATVSGGKWVSTAELKVNLLESTQGKKVVAEGLVLRKGRHLIHAEARAFVEGANVEGTNAEGTQAGEARQCIAVAVGTWHVLPRAFRPTS